MIEELREGYRLGITHAKCHQCLLFCSVNTLLRISESRVLQNEMKKIWLRIQGCFITNSKPGVIVLSQFYNYALKQKYF